MRSEDFKRVVERVSFRGRRKRVRKNVVRFIKEFGFCFGRIFIIRGTCIRGLEWRCFRRRRFVLLFIIFLFINRGKKGR